MRWTAFLLATFPSCVAAQTPSITAVVNEATREPRVCPGARAYVMGSNLGNPSNATAMVGGMRAPVLGSLVEGALVIQIPAELSAGSTSLVVERSGAASSPFSLSLETFVPALYSDISLDSGFSGTSTVPLLVAPSEIVQLTALCLGPTNPPFATNTFQRVPVVNTPRVTVEGQQAEVIEAFHAGMGQYLVRMRVPQGLTDGAHPIVLETAGQRSNSRNVTVSNRPIIRRVFNAASFEPSTSPGSIVSISAENLGTREQLAGFPATEFQGISATFNGLAAPFFHLVPSAKQINVQVPVETPDGQVVTVQVRSALGAGNSFPVVVTPFAPGIFHVTSPSTPTIFRNAAALFAGTAWRVMPRMLARALSIPDDCRGLAVTALCGQPAAPGDYIQVYLTGLGRATPGGDPAGRPLGTGETAALSGNPLYITVQKPNVRIGTIAPEVQFSGVAPGYGGLYQLNLRIPFETPVGDDVPLFVGMTAGDRGYSDTATLAIER